jgi:predicted nucleic acid-binding Zn ribbon protein
MLTRLARSQEDEQEEGEDEEEDEDEGAPKYHCELCGHANVNPERDEDGDLCCEECGEVLAEHNVSFPYFMFGVLQCSACMPMTLSSERNGRSHFLSGNKVERKSVSVLLARSLTHSFFSNLFLWKKTMRMKISFTRAPVAIMKIIIWNQTRMVTMYVKSVER